MVIFEIINSILAKLILYTYILTKGQINEDGDLSTLKCSVCNIVVNSSQQLQMHLSGSKHKAKCRKSEVLESGGNGNSSKFCYHCVLFRTTNITFILLISDDGMQPAPAKQARLFCSICSLSLNSDQQYQQHITSKKHNDKMEGKTPAKKKKKVTF